MKYTNTRKAAVAVAVLLCAALTACSSATTSSGASLPTSSGASLPTSSAASSAASASAQTAIKAEELFSERDQSTEYDEDGSARIQLSAGGVSCSDSRVKIDGGSVTISGEGIFLLSGTLDEGQIVIDAPDSDKVQLVLSGASITSATSAAIYVKNADKVFITLADGTENSLSNGGEFIAVDDNNIDAVIFSKTDLTLSGTGSLTLTCPSAHGVVSKDELTVTGGEYTVTAGGHDFEGKDSIAVSGGVFNITSGKDGLHAENEDDTSSGILYISAGTFNVVSDGDCVSASGAAQIDGGDFTLTAGGGSTAVTMLSDSMGGFGTQNPFTRGSQSSSAAESTESCKGIKAAGALVLNGGVFVIDTADDAFHSNSDLTVCGGDYTIRTGDDAFHSDSAMTVKSGNFSVPYCYEGFEGMSVTVEDGVIDIVSYDDGFNAAGGADSSGFGRGFDMFSSDGNCWITINGGNIKVVSDGDSIDSNGSITVNGGTLNLTCNGNGNSAIDANGTFNNNGGSITTNDGSESGGGGFGGGGFGGGGFGGGGFGGFGR